jgi:hypothetical protein
VHAVAELVRELRDLVAEDGGEALQEHEMEDVVVELGAPSGQRIRRAASRS